MKLPVVGAWMGTLKNHTKCLRRGSLTLGQHSSLCCLQIYVNVKYITEIGAAVAKWLSDDGFLEHFGVCFLSQ